VLLLPSSKAKEKASNDKKGERAVEVKLFLKFLDFIIVVRSNLGHFKRKQRKRLWDIEHNKGQPSKKYADVMDHEEEDIYAFVASQEGGKSLVD
jgi:hypothetical protein